MDQQYPDDPPSRGSFFDVLFMLMVLLASGFSGFTSYLGFSKDLPLYMSISIAVIVFLGLILANFKIRAARRAEESIRAPLVLFLMVFIFSFVSNTNAFYSRMIEDDIVRETQEEAWDVFDKESNRALKLLLENPVYQAELKLIAEVENEITKLKSQITDPRNPGMGKRATEHLNRVTNLLETKVTQFKPPAPGAPMPEFAAHADMLEKHIRQLIDERSKRGVVYTYPALNEHIDALRLKHERRLAHQKYNRRYTEEMRRDLADIENRTNRILSPTPELKLNPVNDKADEVGKFQYTWRNFVDWVSPVAILLAVMLGLILDLLAPIMSIGFYRPTAE